MQSTKLINLMRIPFVFSKLVNYGNVRVKTVQLRHFSRLEYNVSRLNVPKYAFIPIRSKVVSRLNCDYRSFCSNKPVIVNDSTPDALKSEGDGGGVKEGVGAISPKLYLSFKCTVCDESNSYTISKRAYNHGVVIVTCKGCSNNHLIADNLGWFADVEGKNIEEILEKKGEKVLKMLGTDVTQIEPPPDKN